MMTEPRNNQQIGLNVVAALCAWLVPGLGHVVIGEKARGVLVFAGIAFMWVCGILIGGIDAVDRKEDPLWFAAQVCSGPIAFGIDGMNSALLKTGRVGELVDSPAISRNAAPVKVSSYKGIAQVNEYGILFTGLAGLMNLVAIVDASTRRSSERRSEGAA